MPQNLFAACRVDDVLVAKRVRLDANVQGMISGLFDGQAAQFFDGIANEVIFDGRWHPDEDELLTIDVPDEAQVFADTIKANAASIPDIDVNNFSAEGIKALFTGRANNGSVTVLVQCFTAKQNLGRRFSLLQQGNAFRKLSEPAFSLDTSLTCVVEDRTLKFKSQHKLRSIIDLTGIYRAATDQEVRDFALHDSLTVADPDNFVTITNQTTRKLIRQLVMSGTLDAYTPEDISSAAQDTGLNIGVEDGRLVIPPDHAEIKAVLQFLNECRYSGPLSGTPYVTNSQRPA